MNYATYDVTDEELASYGLENPEWSVTVQYTYTDDEEKEVDASYTLHLGENQEERKAADEAEENEEEEIPTVTKYVRIGDSQIVYEVDDAVYETLTAASYDDLRHKEVFWADSDLMTQIDITLEGEEHVLTSKVDEEDEETRNWYYGEEKIELAGLRTALKALMATNFTQETTDQKEEISLTIHLDHEQFQTVDIQLYRYDGTYCLAVIDGESVSLVERSYVMDLVESVQAIVLN